MRTQVVIGVDGGTTAVKAVAFNLDGSIVTMAHRNVPVIYGSNGEAEQNMAEIWNGVADCLKEITGTLGESYEILAVGLTGQGDGLWLVDQEGHPVRNAPNWMDGRAAKRAQEWISDGRGQAILETTGTTIFPGLAPVILAELNESSPDTLEHAATILYCKDWLRFNLTGERLTDYTEASRTFLDIHTAEGYSQSLPNELGIGFVSSLLPEIRQSDSLGGVVSTAAAECTGLPAGTPVGIGMIDVSATGVGLGAVNDGDGWLILGTTGFVGTLLESVDERHSENSMVLATGRDRQVLEFLAPMTGTPNLDWIRITFGYNRLSWDVIERIARTAQPGSNGVIYLPYGSPGGERAPFQDTNASASWMGMSTSSEQHDILRSVYEGVTFSLVECIETLDLKGDLTVSGGGFRSDLICEILADTTERRVIRQDAPEAGARGAAVLALLSAGVETDLKTAANKLATGVDYFEPNTARATTYRKSFETFRTARQAIQPIWPEMRGLRTRKEE